ncbi:glycerate kinase, putative [Eimeria praecox]|uniref:Glycerate kinase, putative n=1 Tax=Eimeria praecox TaxID=51316 RepID=U6H7K3_9EIME|nr:glycerate kinase, putative [Eimeria praecox]
MISTYPLGSCHPSLSGTTPVLIYGLFLAGDLQALMTVAFRDDPSSNLRLIPRRGPPGTHDLMLCRSVLQRIKERKPNIMLPKYDKSQMNGTGDRSNEEVPLDARNLEVFLLEGWMLGFRHVDSTVLTGLDVSEQQRTELRRINEDTRKQTGSGMTACEVNGFVDRFMPLYKVYLPGLYAKPPLSGKHPDDRRCLLVEVTEQRTVKYAAFL